MPRQEKDGAALIAWDALNDREHELHRIEGPTQVHSVDGRRALIWDAGKEQLVFKSVDSNSTLSTVAYPRKLPLETQLAWSPDGEYVAWVERGEPSSVRVVAVATGIEVRNVTVESPVLRITWFPNGDEFAVWAVMPGHHHKRGPDAKAPPGVQIINVQSGERRLGQLTQGSRQPPVPANSNDAKIFFKSEHNGRQLVLVHRASDGTLRMIEDEIVDWTPDANGGVYFFRWENGGRKNALLHWSDATGKTMVADNVSSWDVSSGHVFYLQATSEQRQRVLWHWAPGSASRWIEDEVVDWTVASHGGVCFFRWEYDGRPNALLHWMLPTGKTPIAFQVAGWNLVDSMVYYQSNDVARGVQSWQISP